MIARKFHVLPSVVAKDLDEDPDQVSLQVLPLLEYAEAKSVFDNAEDDSYEKRYKGSTIMEQVKRNTFDLHKFRIERERLKREEKNNG